MPANAPNLLVVLGPTASGKTRLAVQLAREFGGEIASADSRQVYRELTIGSGKDLDEYAAGGAAVPYHLIDIATLDQEFSVFDFQQAFFECFERLNERGVRPILCGGTGLYLEAALRPTRMAPVPEDPARRAEWAACATDDLAALLAERKGELHNTTDILDRDRLIRALEIATYERDHPAEPAPAVRPLILGTRWPRAELHRRIDARLRERLDAGMVEEVETLLSRGVTVERLRALGLEYRYCADFVEGRIRNRNDLRQKLAGAIKNFAKRQETWFRRMERRGAPILWIDRADVDAAANAIRAAMVSP